MPETSSVRRGYASGVLYETCWDKRTPPVGETDERGPVFYGVVVDAVLDEAADGGDLLSQQVLDEVEAVRREVYKGAATGPARVGAPVVFVPLRRQPAGVVDARRTDRPEESR